MGLGEGISMGVFVEEGNIIFEKYERSCIL